jgi:hypothetical protein
MMAVGKATLIPFILPIFYIAATTQHLPWPNREKLPLLSSPPPPLAVSGSRCGQLRARRRGHHARTTTATEVQLPPRWLGRVHLLSCEYQELRTATHKHRSCGHRTRRKQARNSKQRTTHDAQPTSNSKGHTHTCPPPPFPGCWCCPHKAQVNYGIAVRTGEGMPKQSSSLSLDLRSIQLHLQSFQF